MAQYLNVILFVGLDRNGLTVDLQHMVSTAVESSMKDIRLTFASDVTAELKAKIQRLAILKINKYQITNTFFFFSSTDRLVSEMETLQGNKILLETTTSELTIVKETIEELTEIINSNASDHSQQIGTLINSKSGNTELAGINIRMSAMQALLKEVLKVHLFIC